MSEIVCLPLSGDAVSALRSGGMDAYGLLPERTVSDGGGNPCRHCLDFVPAGAGMLILAHRPFPEVQPYAETGPVFLCADACAAWSGEGVPPVLKSSPTYLVKGYTANHRIRYGTGKIVAREDVASYAAALLDRPELSFVDVRSAQNNCFLLRIARADSGGV